jgi:hypothetical protein
MGPARKTPRPTKARLLIEITPVETAPHKKAHIGGNHVMGLINSSDVSRSG